MPIAVWCTADNSTQVAPAQESQSRARIFERPWTRFFRAMPLPPSSVPASAATSNGNRGGTSQITSIRQERRSRLVQTSALERSVLPPGSGIRLVFAIVSTRLLYASQSKGPAFSGTGTFRVPNDFCRFLAPPRIGIASSALAPPRDLREYTCTFWEGCDITSALIDSHRYRCVDDGCARLVVLRARRWYGSLLIKKTDCQVRWC